MGTADAGSTVTLYSNSNCTGAIAGTGTAADFASRHHRLGRRRLHDQLLRDRDRRRRQHLELLATSSPTWRTRRRPPPRRPSPPGVASQQQQPEARRHRGGAVRRSALHDADCTGALAATGTAADFASPGITLTVADDSTTTFHATATDVPATPRAARRPRPYVEDSSAPGRAVGQLDPPGVPANDNTPEVDWHRGSRFDGQLYTTSDCTGHAARPGRANAFASPGITVTRRRRLFDDLLRDGDRRRRQHVRLFVRRHLRRGLHRPGHAVAQTATRPHRRTTTTPSHRHRRGRLDGQALHELHLHRHRRRLRHRRHFALTRDHGLGRRRPSTTFYATATDAAGNTSSCSTARAPSSRTRRRPPRPSVLDTAPGSPANNNRRR